MADAPRIVPAQDQSRFDEVTEASEESFPASDAPSWTSTSSSIANHLPQESRRTRAEAQPRRWGLIAALSAAGGALVYLFSRSRRRTLG